MTTLKVIKKFDSDPTYCVIEFEEVDDARIPRQTDAGMLLDNLTLTLIDYQVKNSCAAKNKR